MTDTLLGLSTALADRYRVERELGAGGMATVYLAHDLKHDRDVAIKVLHADLAAALGAERFLAEIKTTAKLQHPHILALLDSGNADGVLYYVMPFVAGESLRDRLNREKQLPIDDAVRIAREVADALGHAHAHGIVHRDIKPENILLQEGHALVADFGIALAVQSAGGQRMTQTGLSLGTPQYMSPEQAMGERAVDLRADIYALGAVTYEMLTGEPPFTGATVQAIVAKVMSSEPEPLTTTRRTIPPHMEASVLKALAKLPADRFATAAEFAEALAKEATASPSPRLWPSAGIARTPRRLLIAGTGLLLVGTVAGWLARGVPSAASRRGPLLHAMSFVEARGWRNENRLALSPDGSTLAYVAPTADGVSRIWFRGRSELTGTPVMGTEGALNVLFSPEGDRIAFLTDDPLVLRIATPGQPATVLAPVKAGIAGGVGGAWGRDGWIYLGGAGYGTIVRMRPSDGTVEPVTAMVSRLEAWHGQPTLSPDGRTVVFTIADSSLRPAEFLLAATRLGSRSHRVLGKGIRAAFLDDRRVMVVAADGTLGVVPFDAGALAIGDVREIIGEALPIRSLATVDLAHSAAGRLAFVSAPVASPDSAQLAWVSLDGRVTRLDPSWAFLPGGDFALSPDGQRIAVTVLGGAGPDIWMHEVSTGRTTRLTTDGGREPLFSADGRDVMYLKTSRNSAILYSRPANGGQAERVFMQQRSAIHTDATWSPDGRTLVFETWRRGKGEDIMAATASASASDGPKALLETEFNEMNPRLSPDGRWLAYVSDESGRVEVHLRPYPDVSGGHWQVSERGGKEAEWSRDGRRLFYFDLTDTLRAVAVTAASSSPLGRTTTLFAGGGWRRTSSVLRSGYNIAPSGDRLLVSLRRTGAQPLQQVVVVEDYPGLLRTHVRDR